jgi:hypothetical protein
VLDRVGVALVVEAGIAPSVARGATPSQQIPELIEAHLKLLQFRALVRGESSTLGVMTQLVLSRDQVFDSILHSLIGVCSAGAHQNSIARPSSPGSEAAVS